MFGILRLRKPQGLIPRSAAAPPLATPKMVILGRLTLTVTSTRRFHTKCKPQRTSTSTVIQCIAPQCVFRMPTHDNKTPSAVATYHGDPTIKPHEFQETATLRTKLRGFPWRILLITSLLPLSLSPIIILSAIAEMASQNYIRGRACYPNGLWKEATGATWRIMDSTYFFTPNLSFGAMTFTQVKVIDVAWDLVIGRGGQMGLAWVNWVVFNEWLVYHLERWRTTYKLYTTVALQTTSWTMLGVSAKEFLCFGGRSWSRFFRWIAMFCLFISTLYVLAFPTLMAAMTGYITTYEPYMEDYDHNLIDLEKVEEVVGMVQDATRLNLGFENPLL